MKDVTGDYRYMYKNNDPWGEGVSSDGYRYGCLTAVSMKDARQHLRRVAGLVVFEIRRVRLDPGMMHLAESATYVHRQNVRKAIFDGARIEADLDAKIPGWRSESPGF